MQRKKRNVSSLIFHSAMQNIRKNVENPTKPGTKPEVLPTRSRRLTVQPVSPRLLDRALAVMWPWSVWEYPGRGRLRAWLVGMASVSSAADYRLGDFPAFRARIMADRMEGKARDILAMASELRAYAVAKDARTGPRGFQRKVPLVVPPPSE